MSTKIDSEFSFQKFFRINFVGRPIELKKLVFEDSSLIQNEEEVKRVVTAFNLYMGHKNLGNLSSIFLLLMLSKSTRIKISAQYKVLISSIPMIFLHTLSFFVYWNRISDLVKLTRIRHKDSFDIDLEEKKIIYNLSHDLHQEIGQQIGIIRSIYTTINFYIGKV